MFGIELNGEHMTSILSAVFILLYVFLLLILVFFICKKKWCRLTSENLFKQKMFWVVIAVSVFSFLYFGFFSWKDYTPRLDKVGMMTFIEISTFPLLFLAASVPLGAIVTNLHRTYQVEAQLKASEEKNNLDGYYSHNKSYVEIFSKIEDSKPYIKEPKVIGTTVNSLQIIVDKPHGLYKKIYPDSSPKNGPQYNASSEFLRRIGAFIDRYSKSVLKLDGELISNKLNCDLYGNDEDFREVIRNMELILFYLNCNNDIDYKEVIEVNDGDKVKCVKITVLRIRILTSKLRRILIQLLDSIDVTNKNNPELYNKIKNITFPIRDVGVILNDIKFVSNSTKENSNENDEGGGVNR